jgi:hypothetical protein
MQLPDDDTLRWIVTTLAHLRAAHGEVVGAPPLLQPTSEFFPDEFRHDVASVGTLLRRMIEYAPLRDGLPVALELLEAAEAHAGGCGSIACGTGGGTAARGLGAEPSGGGYRVRLAVTDVAQADLLTTSLARSVGALVLHEAGEDVDANTSEIAAVTCGFGVLLANGASVWAKSCGGLRMTQATSLPVEAIAVALALFVALHGGKASDARRHLGATQREAYDVAEEWVASNAQLIDALRERPAMIATRVFDVEPVRGLLGRWLHRRRTESVMRAAPARQAPPMGEERRRRLEEARALVDEVMPGAKS